MENQNPKENKRKAIVLLVVALIAVVAMIAGATYAYFQAQQGKGQSSDVNVTTGTIDNLNFNILDLDATRTDIVDEDNEEVPINITANMNNFTDKDTSLGDGVTATATLIANDANYIANDTYNVYLYITKNELQYSSYKRNNPLDPDTDNKNILVFKTEEEKSDAELGEYSPIPELYLTIKKNGTEITSGVKINDEELTHLEGILVDPDNEVDSTSKTLGGFDITETKGLIQIKINEAIEVENGDEQNHTTTDTWEIIVTFINLGTDQNLNTGKTLTGKVLIQKEEYIPTLAELCTGEKASECFTKNYKKDKAIVYHNAIAAKEDGIQNQEKIAGDDSYRYVGANPNNYVCFGATCSNEGTNENYKNLYRIIGFFKNEDATSEDYGNYEMKIIKADLATKEDLGEGTFPESAYRSNGSTSSYQSTYKGKLTNYGSYSWNDTAGTSSDNNNVNMWAASNLNTKNLNGTYYNAIDGTYQSMVVEHKWEVGAAWSSGDAKAVYDYELGTNKSTDSSNNCYTQGNTTDKRLCSGENDLTYKDEVGLMYVSDYMYATLPEYWNTTAGSYSNEDVKTNNWLYLGITEWTISRDSSNGDNARRVYDSGYAGNILNVSSNYGVRPVVYLTSDVKIISGSGTDSDPFMLGM